MNDQPKQPSADTYQCTDKPGHPLTCACPFGPGSIPEDKLAHAQERANATRRPYIVSDEGHVMVDVAHNRVVFAELGLTVVAVCKPQSGVTKHEQRQ